MRVTVSGVGGFVGAHLVRELVAHGHEVVGLGNSEVADDVAPLLADHHAVDLAQEWPDTSPDAVVHLAGLSAVGPSFADPQGYLHGNSAPMTRLGELLLASGGRPRVLAVSTGAVYAPGTGIAEDAPVRASSPYVVSKLLLEAQCAYYRTRGLDVVVARPFNHLGPGQREGFLLPDLLVGLRRGDLVVGDLSTRRDYTDVRDVVRAYRLLLEAPEVRDPVLNICSGSPVSGEELLGLAAEATGLAARPRHDPARVRPDDSREISGDAGLLRAAVGWSPEVDLGTTVRDVVQAATG